MRPQMRLHRRGMIAARLRPASVSRIVLRRPRADAIAGVLVLFTAAAPAGALQDQPSPASSPYAEGYRLSDACKEPAAPAVSARRASRIGASSRARDRAIRQYNEHVEAVNAYLVCLQAEADRDVQAFYAAVNAAFDEKQKLALDGAARFRRLFEPPAPAGEEVEAETEPMEPLEGASDGGGDEQGAGPHSPTLKAAVAGLVDYPPDESPIAGAFYPAAREASELPDPARARPLAPRAPAPLNHRKLGLEPLDANALDQRQQRP